MPNPKRRHSNQRTRKRRTHDAIKTPKYSKCPRCNQAKMPHRICPNCGFYKDKDVEYKTEKKGV